MKQDIFDLANLLQMCFLLLLNFVTHFFSLFKMKSNMFDKAYFNDLLRAVFPRSTLFEV